jgi:hypothetical protein
VYGYHNHPYRCDSYRYFTEEAGSCIRNPALGVEFEHYCADTYGALQSIDLDWILERDRSLDRQYGVEMISPPLLLSTWQEKIPEICKAISDNDGKAYDAPNGIYGIHITVHRRHLTALQEIRMLMFLISEENGDFVRAIGQRKSIYSAYAFNIGSHEKARQKVRQLGGLRRHTGKISTQKMCPLHLEGDLAECRIFQSTLSADAFVKHVEFFAALIQWTRPSEMTGTSWNHADFYAWLKDHAKEYPKLAAWLKKPEFKVKGGSTIENTWS